MKRLVACCAALLLAAVVFPARGETPERAALEPYRAPAMPTGWTRAKLTGFVRELADFVYAKHVVTDPDRMVYGMTYEFWQDGKQIQAFSLDAMHDGCWLTSAMCVAHRADPEGRYLERAQKYQVPFYVNMINQSDRLFADRMKSHPGKLTAPGKGWVPRGWDDGLGYDMGKRTQFKIGFDHATNAETTIIRKDGQFAHAYFTPSNHLAQDLSHAMLDVWLTTRDPQVATAAANVRQNRLAEFGPIPICDLADAVTNRKPLPVKTAPAFAPSMMVPYYTGLYEQKGHSLTSYDDGLAWAYRMAAAGASVDGSPFPPNVALTAAARAYGHALGMEAYCDDQAFRPGTWFFDLQVSPKFVEGTGQLDLYQSDGKKVYGPRGNQISYVAAGVLPVLKKQPELWEQYYRQKHATEALVRIVDMPPTTDGKRDAAYDQSKTLGDAQTSVALLADPKHLHVLVESTLPEVTLNLKPAGKVIGTAHEGRLTISRAGKVEAVNEKGEALLHASAFTPGDRWTAELRIPHAVVKGQKPWLNIVEHGRYAVAINGTAPVTVYGLSAPERIVRRLELLALGTIDTWHAVYRELGLLPSGYRSPHFAMPRWDVSDSGSYAALIQTIALWLIYQDGKAEWDIIRAQAPAQPLLAAPLPDSVLARQGLK